MKAFTQVNSAATPLLLDEVDTDQIIPAAFLTSVSRQGYGENLFRGIRDSDDGFLLNQEAYLKRSILIAGNNFGCGSSREHAVWALMDFGFKVVIAKSFADIFSSNSAKNGLLLITLPAQVVEKIASVSGAQDPKEISVDLAAQVVSVENDGSYEFEYDQFRKHCLLNGLDDIDYIRSKSEQLNTFRMQQASRRFVKAINC